MHAEPPPFSRDLLLEYFARGAAPRSGWKVGMEIERLGRHAETGAPLPYSGAVPSVLSVLEWIMSSRGGRPVMEAEHLIGIDADWGTISLEPGGQVEWSSRPETSLGALREALGLHEAAMRESARELGVHWVEEAVDPDLPLTSMIWMPKARYGIMREFLGKRGGLAHRMMTQTASIQCAFDYADEKDWLRKFKTAALLTPVATALFANSARVDGGDSGMRCYRQAIWRDTDPDRCGLPRVVFEPGFDMARWLDWVLDTPTIFRHRARGLVPSGGVPFRSLLDLVGCDAIRNEDWETHVSTIFTDVRSYNYIEVRSADLQPAARVFAVPTLWTGLLYDESALEEAGELASLFDEYDTWRRSVDAAILHGLDAVTEGRSLRELASRLVTAAIAGIERGAACATDPAADVIPLTELAETCRLELNA